MKKNKVKLLSPAGSYEAAIAAIQNGADEIYVGGPAFGARAYADNLGYEELKNIIAYAHVRDVDVYVTVNTLVLEKELEQVKHFIGFLYKADVDGVIVQDVGLLSYIRRSYPDLKIVASTQMNIHNVEGVQFLKSLGVSRVVMAREVDIEVIKQIKQQVDIEIEVFCHGALCVSYSGNCLLSSFIGKRSGNRGKCAQPCRLSYQMQKDGELIGDESYLLSTKELMTLDHLQEYIDAGVDSLKIEGRMKSPTYVALTTRIYQQALVKLNASLTVDTLQQDKKELAKMFNRSFTKGYVFFEHDGDLMHPETSNHQGIIVGRVMEAVGAQISILLEEDLNFNDGIRIVDDEQVSGFMVNEMYQKGQLVKHAAAGTTVALETKAYVAGGAVVLKTLDAVQNDALTKTYDKEYKKISLQAFIKARKGYPLVIEITDGKHEIAFTSDYIVEQARTRPMGFVEIHDKLSKLGHTPYRLEAADCHYEIDEDIIVPIKFINEAKNDLIEHITFLRSERYNRQDIKEVAPQPLPTSVNQEGSVILSAKVHTLDQLDAAIETKVDCIYVDDEAVYQQAILHYPDAKWGYAFPRIVENYAKSATLVDNVRLMSNPVVMSELGGFSYAHSDKVVDSYVNIINHEALAFALQYASRVTLSLESSYENSKNLLTAFKQEQGFNPFVAQVVYGYMDAMLLKHCPIAKANDIRVKHCDECRRHTYQLVDRMGYQFPFVTYQDCHVRLLNSKRNVLYHQIPVLLALGIKELRLDFTIESKEETKTVIQVYQQKLKDDSSQYGFGNATFGHYFEDV